MGGFYGSVQVRGDDREPVLGVVATLARKGGDRFLVGPPLSGWIGVYPHNGGQDPRVAREIARKLPGELLYLVVHDDDIFAYEYYRDGKRIDRYNSCPDYFEEVCPRERNELRGRPETLAHLAADAEQFAALRQRLAGPADHVVFASELLAEFADALGIPNALSSYEYLNEDEGADLEGRDQFVHMPDVTRERAGRRRAETALRDETARLEGEGLLLAEVGSSGEFAAPAPQWCPAPDGQGFLVAWMRHLGGAGTDRPLERYGPPWPAGPQLWSLTVDPRVFAMELSPTGRYLAVGHAAGDWRAVVYDLHDNRRVADATHTGAVAWVGFTRDETAMVSISSQGENGQAVVVPLRGADNIRTIPLRYAKLGAVHPSGNTLAVVDHRDRLLVVDLASGTIVRTLYVGGRQDLSGPYLTMMAQVQAQASAIDVNEMERTLRKQQEQVLRAFEKTGLPAGMGSVDEIRERMAAQVEEQIKRMHEHYAQLAKPGWQAEQVRGNEIVCRLKFDPAGARLFAATSHGVRVYDWEDLVQSEDGSAARPVRAVDLGAAAGQAPQAPAGAQPNYVYDLDHDADRSLLVFGSYDGLVRYHDLEGGHTGVLVEAPGRPPITRLGLSRDRTALAVTCHPGMLATRRKPRGPVVQFWDYSALCQRL